MISEYKKNQNHTHKSSRPIEEKNEWVFDQLSKIWGENQADYFTNPARLTNRNASFDKTENDKDRNSIISNTKKPQKGLYANAIWESIREDTNINRLKPFDLDKELQNLNYYDKVKKTMDNVIRNSRNQKTIGFEEEEEEILKIIKRADMSKIKQAKIYRNEIELMYRSSKLNEEKSNFLKSNSPLANLNDIDGNESISRYLPPIELYQETKLAKPNSALEFITSPNMKNKLKKQLENKVSDKRDNLDYKLIEANYKNRSKYSTHNVKLQFLVEKPARDYLDSKTDYTSENQSMFDNTKSEARSSYNYINESKSSGRTEGNNKSQTIYPPLTLNALMEYKPLIKAPGIGEFENGKPKLFKVANQ